MQTAEILARHSALGSFAIPQFQFIPLPAPETTGFLGISPDAWVAIFTGLLVVATIIQSGFALRADALTRKALKVSQSQAATARSAAIAALSVDLPDLVFSPPDGIAQMQHQPLRGRGRADSWNTQLPNEQSYINMFRVYNVGRTTAKTIRARLGVFVGHALPERPHYQYAELKPADGLLKEGMNVTVVPDPPISLGLTAGDNAAIVSGRARVWAFADISYQDFQDREHIRGAVWIWTRMDDRYGFMEDKTAPPAYRERFDDYSDFGDVAN